MNKHKAQLIAIEGSDGAGKDTQTNLLCNYFTAQGKKVARVSFPRYEHTRAGKLLFEAFKSERAPHYDFVHTSAKAASLVYAADRIESLPFLAKLIATHDVVIFDRYVESNLLHQGGKLKKAEREEFAKWLYTLEYEINQLPKPDVIIYLSVPHTISIKRAEDRARLKNKKPDALEQNRRYVKQGNLAGVYYANLLGWHVVDCVRGSGKSLYELNPEEVHQKVVRLLSGW